MTLYANGKRVCSTNVVYEAPIEIPRTVNANGVYGTTGITSFTLPNNAIDLGSYALYYSFYGCSSLIFADLSSLVTISGSGAMQSAFLSCTSLASVDLSSLETISTSGSMRAAFTSCTSLASIDLSSLSAILSSRAMQNTFQSCTSLASLSFPALSNLGSYTTQFDNMLRYCSGVTVHFPSNLQSVLGSWSSVTRGFGGSNTTVLFDLPATT